MRKPPTATLKDVPATVPTRADTVVHERRYELITPLFGGGVKAGETDPITVINGKSVRGQLRFWWRATRGGQFGKLPDPITKLREAEVAIWGAASIEEKNLASKVEVTVTEWQRGKGVEVWVDTKYGRKKVHVSDQTSPYGYVAFPLQDKQQINVFSQVTFKLRVTFPKELEKDVEAAFWAWETFGGIGARTRRGFGAIKLVEKNVIGDATPMNDILSPDTGKVKTWVMEKMKYFEVKGTWPKGVTHLPPNVQSNLKVFKAEGTTTEEQADNAWRTLIKKLKEFRQARYDKNSGKRVSSAFGLSQWPEANEIRRRLYGLSGNAAKFPRAVFGLPINFHLPHDPNEPTIVLTGTNINRWASPVLMRPLVCSDEKVVGLALLLEPNTLPSDPLRLDGIGANTDPIEVSLTIAEAKDIVAPLSGQPKVLETFLGRIDQKETNRR